MTLIVDAPPGLAEEYYINLHCVACNTVERTIGVQKNWWRCLLGHRVLHYHPDKAANAACWVLHNICNQAQLGLPYHWWETKWVRGGSRFASVELRRGRKARAQLAQELWIFLVRTIFWLRLILVIKNLIQLNLFCQLHYITINLFFTTLLLFYG